MGEHNKWRNYNQDGLRRRYMALLVPALAKINADHPQGSGQQLQRARAVRRAADTCLAQALANINSCSDHPHQLQQLIQRPRASLHTCLHPAPAASISSRLRIKASAARRGSFSSRLHALIIKGKANAKADCSSGARRRRSIRLKANLSIKRGARAALCRADHCKPFRSSYNGMRQINRRRHADDREIREEGSIPEESELRRLQSVLFPHRKSTQDGAAAAAAGDDQAGYSSCSVINPAALLSQAAQYIMALQVQVDALRSLASLSVDSPSPS